MKGFTSYVVLIAIALIVVIGVIIFGSSLINKKPLPSPTPGNKAPEINCESRDYGGCDEEKNFYKWTDDGLD